jgi:ferredoxin-nitrite reductase
MSVDAARFSVEQQEYLKGLMAGGVEARRAAFGLRLVRDGGTAADPNDLQRAAQDRTVGGGGKLVAEEAAKRSKPPLGRFDEVKALAKAGQFPKGTDVFLTFGLFYVAPAQNAFMCRLRIPGGITAAQFRGVAAIADDLGGGYADITTRANLQLREIEADGPPEVLMRLSEIGLTSRGSGADNIRNITGSPTAGDRPAGTDRYAAARKSAAPLHPAPSGTVWPAAQVQHRLRWRRPRCGSARRQRHRLHRGHRGRRFRGAGRGLLTNATH